MAAEADEAETLLRRGGGKAGVVAIGVASLLSYNKAEAAGYSPSDSAIIAGEDQLTLPGFDGYVDAQKKLQEKKEHEADIPQNSSFFSNVMNAPQKTDPNPPTPPSKDGGYQ